MSGAMREKDTADYDLERFVEMFDQALTSDDPRVKNALRQLMMMVILTDNDDHEGEQRVKKHGPLRRMQEDVREQWQYFRRLEQEIEKIKQSITYNQMQQPTGPGYRAQDYNLKYADTTAGMGIDPKDYWNSVIAQKASNAEIPASSLRGLNIKVATDTGEK